MSLDEFFRSLSQPETSTDAPVERVWDCSSSSAIFHAAFEAHEEALRAGFMPDEATTLSLSLAELGSQAMIHGQHGQARVQLGGEGWRLEVTDASPRAGRIERPVLKSPLPMPLTSLNVRTERGQPVVVAHYERPSD